MSSPSASSLTTSSSSSIATSSVESSSFASSSIVSNSASDAHLLGRVEHVSPPRSSTSAAAAAAAPPPLLSAASSASAAGMAPASRGGSNVGGTATQSPAYAPPQSPSPLLDKSDSQMDREPLKKKSRMERARQSKCCMMCTQQTYPYWQPIMRPIPVILGFLIAGAFFIILGGPLLAASLDVVEISKRYDNICERPPTYSGSSGTPGWPQVSTSSSTVYRNDTTAVSCSLTFLIPKKMKKPIYIYYDLDNVYQNHRRFVSSRSDDQLSGDTIGYSAARDVCTPIASFNKIHKKEAVWAACGLVSWSVFNDTYTFRDATSSIQLPVSRKGVAWPNDQERRYKNPKGFNKPGRVIKATPLINIALFPDFVEDDAFAVWMRTAALPRFRKLWGKIQQDLDKDQLITVQIENRWPVHQFDGEKRLLLSTTSWIGGRNNFLGIAYLVLGILLLFSALVFIVLELIRPRKLGDASYLKWK